MKKTTKKDTVLHFYPYSEHPDRTKEKKSKTTKSKRLTPYTDPETQTRVLVNMEKDFIKLHGKDAYKHFWKWMNGQTIMGVQINGKLEGGVFYTDYERFMEGWERGIKNPHNPD